MDVGWWALIVSGLSFGVSALTFWRNRTPKPHWVLTWDGGPEDVDVMTDSIRCVALNRGRGVARDVRLEAITVDGRRGFAVEKRDELAFNQEIALWFSFEDGVDSAWGRGEVAIIDPQLGRSKTFTTGHFARSTMTVRLAWSQEPNLKRRRKKKTTYTKPQPVTKTSRRGSARG